MKARASGAKEVWLRRLSAPELDMLEALDLAHDELAPRPRDGVSSKGSNRKNKERGLGNTITN